MEESVADGLPDLAVLLEVPEALLREAVGGPWSPGEDDPALGGIVTIFTGRENPRTPGRPLIAVRIDHADQTVEIGHAVGVPLPNGRLQWVLGEPRTLVPYGPDEFHDWLMDTGTLGSSSSPDDLVRALLIVLQDAMAKVAETAMLRGTSW